jgi:uncharacterized protein (DUF342 family)
MAAIIAKGTASISVNAQETEAKLRFIPDPDGFGWDADAVIKLIGENRLSPPPSPKVLEPFLQKAARSKTTDSMEMVIYEGIPPEEPVDETVNWEAAAVPADIAPFQEEALAKAGAPDLYRIKTEKIKKESMVKKAGALPFLPAKEETVVSWEKKETREKAEVNPEPKEIRYAEEGKKLGTVIPAKPGKPGKSVYGRPVPPASQGGTGFLLGGGLNKQKSDLYAAYSGLLRIGENWADIVPLAKPVWSVDRGSDGMTLFFKFKPGDSRFPPPAASDVRAAAAAMGAVESVLIPSEAIEEKIQTAIKTGKAFRACPLFRVQEAEARVDISPDQVRATLNLSKGVAGGQPLEMKAISSALRDSGIHGFDTEKLKADLKAFMEGPDLELKDYLLVEGKPSTRGKDREVELAVKLLDEPAAKPLLERLAAQGVWIAAQKSGQEEKPAFPLESATGFALVGKGAKVAQVSSSVEGEAGKDVFGQTTPALPGNDPELKLFSGLGLHGSDITATQEGLLLIKAAAGSFWAQVISFADAKVTVRISADAMEASADIQRELGAGIPLTRDLILKALANAGVVQGINSKAVEAALAAARGGNDGCTGWVLARGEPALAKGASLVKWHIDLGPLSPVAAEPATAVDTAPDAEAAVIRTVQITAGSAIAEILPGDDAGRPGFDVKGRVIPVEQGITQLISHDETVKEIPLGMGMRLSAACSGKLSYDGTNLQIISLQSLNSDVGPATGNVAFSGELRVAGKVLPGFQVMGGLDVFIGGSADAALVSAGGKAVIAGGIKGGGKGVVRARNAIETAFAEGATLLTVEDIKVKSGCVRCNIKTNGKLFITAGTGKLIGGVCRARHGVDSWNIGSEKGIRTEISFGQDYLIKDQIEAAERELEKTRIALAQADQKIKQAAGTAVLDTIRPEKVRLLKLQKQLNLKIFTLQEKFEEHHNSEIRVRGTVYPGVVMESHNRYYEVNQMRAAVIFYFDQAIGGIREKPLEN